MKGETDGRRQPTAIIGAAPLSTRICIFRITSEYYRAGKIRTSDFIYPGFKDRAEPDRARPSRVRRYLSEKPGLNEKWDRHLPVSDPIEHLCTLSDLKSNIKHFVHFLF
jgi:hypothetical protein